MLCIRGYRVMRAPSGKARLHQYVVFHTWTNEEVEDFDFDVMNPREWKKYLSTFRLPNNKLLPKKTKDGESVRYQVYFWGSPKWVRQHLLERYGISPKQGFAVLFPGYDKDGNSADVMKYGRI